MNSKIKIILVCFMCLSFSLLLLIKSASCQEGKIFPGKKITGHQTITLNDLTGLSKRTITIEFGTTVIWVNNALYLMQLKFSGKQVTMACASPVHFVVDEEGSFVSDKIPPGAVASLCFIEKGEFNYMMRKAEGAEFWTKKPEYIGKIIVK